ncbi:MAG: class I SAM-dependent methyltransferase [ANME-2 cluster archaeon]|nr:class I SAM-dependent methyltransferase [ANME-2 cluster archaeon]
MAMKKYEKAVSGNLHVIKNLIQIILYVLIQIIFIPFAIVGLIDGIYKEMVISKKRGVSFSAGQSLQYRWIMHYFDTRPDKLSIEFVKKFPCESHFGLWTIMGALIISQRYFGFTTKMGRLPDPGKESLDSTAGARVLAFDRIMEKYIDEMDQIVLLGAGFDLIALNFTENKNIKVFELDQSKTLDIKVETLKKAGINHDWINFVPVDYSRELWADKLLEAGFDDTKKTLFIWESVSLFLEEEVVKETLRDMVDLCADGSVVAQDFYSKAFVSGEISSIVRRNSNLIEKMGEPWKFGIDMSNDPKEAANSFLELCGFKMTDYIQFGEKTDIEPYYCIVEAEKL